MQFNEKRCVSLFIYNIKFERDEVKIESQLKQKRLCSLMNES